jgi:predicted phosphodiesterase
VKILALSDQVVDRLYDLVPTGHFRDIDLIVGCGDLPYEYLEHMVSALNLDLLYVPGNHDPAYSPAQGKTFVHGGTNLDLKVIRLRGMVLAGFGGSIRYRPDAPNQYSRSHPDAQTSAESCPIWKNSGCSHHSLTALRNP